MSNGGIETVSGMTTGTTVSSGGTQFVKSGGLSIGARVASGGTEQVSASGKASGTIVSNGGTELLAIGGTALGASVAAGGILSAAGVLLGTIADAGQVIGGTVSSGGSLVVSRGGTASGGTVASGGTEIVLSGGTAIDTVVAAGGTEIISAGGVLAYDNGGTFGGTLLGAGTLDLEAGSFTFAGTPGASAVGVVLSGGSLAIKQSETFGGFTYSAGSVTISSGTTLTISGAANLNGAQIDGPGTLVTDGATTFTDIYLDGKLAWVNSGTVTDSDAVYLNYPSGSGSIVITNAATGVFNLGAGDPLYIYGGSATLANAGTLQKLGGAADTQMFAVVNNTGLIDVASGTLEFDAGGVLGGTIEATKTGELSYTAGTYTMGGKAATISGPVLLDGAVISIASGDDLTLSGSVAMSAGSISGAGTLSTAGSFAFSNAIISGDTILGGSNVTIGNGGTFSGVTYRGTLGLGDGSDLTVTNGLAMGGATGTGAGAINLTGLGSVLYYDGTGTVNNAAITIGNDSQYEYGQELYVAATAAGGVLTLGTATSLTQSGLYAYLSDSGQTGDGIVNDGTITAGVSGGTFYINNSTFANAGVILVGNGDTLVVNSTTFTNTGTLALSGTSTFEGSISGGVVTAGTATVLGGNPTLAGVTFLGTLNLNTGEAVTIENGITLHGASGTGVGTINLTGLGSVLYYDGTGTLNNAAITIGNSSQYEYGQELIAYDNMGSGAVLTLGPATSLTQSGLYAYLSDSGRTTDGIVNDGTITAGVSGGQFEISGNSFANAGLITVSGGDTLYVASTTFTNSGTISLGASTLAIASDPTIVNSGTLIKTAGTVATAISVFVSNTGALSASAGTLELDGGATLNGTVGGTGTTGVVLLANGVFTTTGTATIADDGTSNGLVLASGETWTDTGTILDAGHLALGNVSAKGLATLAIGAHDSFDLTGNDAAITLKASATITNAGTIGKTGGTGDAIISVGIANTGLIDAAAGTLTLSGSVSGTGNVRIETGSVLEIATALGTAQTLTFNGAGATLKLDKPASVTKAMAGFGVGNSIDLAGVTVTGAGVTGSTLTVTAGATSYTFAAAASLAGDRAAFKSDGAGGSIVTLYAKAAAAAHTPEPVAFGNVHVGATATQALTITNTAPSGAYTEGLDASLTGVTTGFTTAGTIGGLAGGATNSTALTITETAANAGTFSGTATLGLTSDGTGIDNLGTAGLPSQAVTLSGAVYAYAAPILSTSTINLGDARLGGTLGTGTITLADGTAATHYQESLVYAATGAVTLSNASGTIAAGGTAPLGLSLGTGTAGNFNGSVVTVGLTSTGAGTSGLADTPLPSDTVTVNAEVFAPAVATLAGSVVNFGIIHVGDTTQAVQSLGVSNGGTGSLVDLLTAGTATTTGAVSSVSYAGLGTGLAAGSSASISIALNTATAGTVSGNAVLGFTSHDSALADLAISGGTVTVSGIIDNYATAQAELAGGTGTLTPSGGNYTLNLGSISQGSGSLTADLGVINAAVGTADLLGGSFTVSGAAAYANTGLTPFSGLGAGQSETSQVVSLSAATAGVFTETILLHPTGSNASGYSGALAAETITVTGTVVSNGSTYTLTAAPTTITGTTGNDTINAPGNTLNSHDVINGGAGVNTLNLIGGGYFDLGAPSTLSNIQAVTAQESTAGTTVYMRNALDGTLTVTPGGTGSILIYGATGTGVYDLGAGSDTVVLGAATEAVNAGGGTALVQGTAAFAHALVNGGTVGSPGTTTLEITTGGTATLNGGDTNLIGKLDAATNLSLGTASFITAEGAAKGGDTLTAGAANQTLESLGGKDTLVGFTGFGDTFLGTAAGFTGDTIKNFGGSDGIDFTDLLFATIKPLAYAGTTSSGKLTVTDGTHSGSVTLSGSYTLGSFTPINDGHGGTLIQFV